MAKICWKRTSKVRVSNVLFRQSLRAVDRAVFITNSEYPTNRSLTVTQESWPTVGNLLAYSWPTVRWGELIFIIDHFHYDVTRAKVSGSCSKDRAQCRGIAGKCQKISRSAMSAKASHQVFYKVMCSIATQIQRNSAWSFLCFFFR